MKAPGEELVIRLWETLVERGIGGLLRPWQIRREGMARLDVRRQEVLMLAAAELVRPGGVLVYSVCTLTRAETIDVDEWAARHLHGFDALPRPGAPWQPLGRGALLLPHAAGTDGMFVLSLRRNDEAPRPGTLNP